MDIHPPTRNETWALLNEFNSNPSLLNHALGVEAVMRYRAVKAGEDAEKWGIIGLVHDLDYERHPEVHCVKTKEILDAADAIRRIFVSPYVKRYIVDLTRRTRESEDVYLGASPRGSLGLFRSAQARAALQGRDFVLPDDVKAMAVPVLGHRIIVSPAARLRDLSADRLVEEIVRSQPSPGGDFTSGESVKSRKGAK